MTCTQGLIRPRLAVSVWAKGSSGNGLPSPHDDSKEKQISHFPRSPEGDEKIVFRSYSRNRDWHHWKEQGLAQGCQNKPGFPPTPFLIMGSSRHGKERGSRKRLQRALPDSLSSCHSKLHLVAILEPPSVFLSRHSGLDRAAPPLPKDAGLVRHSKDKSQDWRRIRSGVEKVWASLPVLPGRKRKTPSGKDQVLDLGGNWRFSCSPFAGSLQLLTPAVRQESRSAPPARSGRPKPIPKTVEGG